MQKNYESNLNLKSTMDVVIIDYGAGNIKSLEFALQRLGLKAHLSNEETVIRIIWNHEITNSLIDYLPDFSEVIIEKVNE